MKYRCLNCNDFRTGEFSIVPLQNEDKYDIMTWRNEQIYHLRQDKLLSRIDQDNYFEKVVSKLYDEEKPKQILFSFLEGRNLIGYGGLVHINWIDRNAEISFIMNTSLEEQSFEFYWKVFLRLIEQVAFTEIELHKIFTYAFDMRPRLYKALNDFGYSLEARLQEHCRQHDKYIDVVINAKVASKPYLRKADIADTETTFYWANDESVRRYAFNQERITFESHQTWFNSKITNHNVFYNLLCIGIQPIGSIRLDINDQVGEGVISYLISPDYVGKGYGKKILELTIEAIKDKRKEIKTIVGLVNIENLASIKIFNHLGFEQNQLKSNLLEFRKKINHED